MNYKNLYAAIIHNAKEKSRKKSVDSYYELHHIIPRCLDGTDTKENLVLLTPKEHFVCHHILTKIYPSSKEILFAFRMMMYCKDKNQKRYTPLLQYQKTKMEFSKIMSNRWKNDNPNNYRNNKGENNPMFGSHRIGELNPFYGKKHTEESKKKQSLAKLNSNFVFTEEHRNKLKLAWSQKPIITCPICGLESTHKGNMNRYHFEKCRLNGNSD